MLGACQKAMHPARDDEQKQPRGVHVTSKKPNKSDTQLEVHPRAAEANKEASFETGDDARWRLVTNNRRMPRALMESSLLPPYFAAEKERKGQFSPIKLALNSLRTGLCPAYR